MPPRQPRAKAADAPRLVIYIPTFRNPEGVLHQVVTIRRSEERQGAAPWQGIDVVVSINGGDYDQARLLEAGATTVRARITDLGGDANIALGLLEVRVQDYLWILSDNDPLQIDALRVVADAFLRNPDAGMVVAASSDSLLGHLELSGSVADFGGDLHAGLISGVIYRVSAIRVAIPFALQCLWTGWTQIALQDFAIKQGTLNSAICVPVGHLIDHRRGDQSDSSVARARIAYTHSYFGGALLSYITAEAASENGRKSLSRWWYRQWMYASAYRPPLHPHRSKRRQADGNPITNFRAGLTDALVRTGNIRDRILWFASWLPYWRFGVYLRRRGVRTRWWT